MRKATILLALALVGCATILDGSTETVRINSEPPGAKIVVDGTEHVTPTVLSLARDAEHYVLFPNGQRVEIKRGFSGTTLLNLLLGGIPGLIVDAVSGAINGNLSPDALTLRDGSVFNDDTKRRILGDGTDEETEESQAKRRQGSHGKYGINAP